MPKAQNQSWPDYLQQGVMEMEGIGSGRRRYDEAGRIFAECAYLADDEEVQIEALFRLAQCEYYQRRLFSAAARADRAQHALAAGTIKSLRLKQQCMLIYNSTVREVRGDYKAALASYDSMISVHMPDQPKLMGDIENRRARLYLDHWQDLDIGSHKAALRLASQALLAAEVWYLQIANPTAIDYHALAAVSNRAAKVLQLYGFALGRQAEDLFAQKKVTDPTLRMTHLGTRVRMIWDAVSQLPYTIVLGLRWLMHR